MHGDQDQQQRLRGAQQTTRLTTSKASPFGVLHRVYDRRLSQSSGAGRGTTDAEDATRVDAPGARDALITRHAPSAHDQQPERRRQAAPRRAAPRRASQTRRARKANRRAGPRRSRTSKAESRAGPGRSRTGRETRQERDPTSVVNDKGRPAGTVHSPRLGAPEQRRRRRRQRDRCTGIQACQAWVRGL